MTEARKVRTRYAPSPTGFQHVGGIRTAIINYLVARHFGGEFIIRMEDTDQNRLVADAEDYILRSLDWLQIPHKEGPDVGGPFGPYRQSDRLPVYVAHAMALVDTGKAYYAFDTTAALEDARAQCHSNGREFLYNYLNRDQFQNSYTLSPADTLARIEAKQPYTIRLALPPDTSIDFNDLIRGDLSVETAQLEDKILLKSDGWPTYHLASVVDDQLMQISHVIRGEEWLPSAPVHHFLYAAFGWEATKPAFAHLPLILNPDGDGKLSKRKLKDSIVPIFPLNWVNADGLLVRGLREEGFMPDAVINFLVLLGWHDSNDTEIYSRDELARVFEISHIQKSGAKFDLQKARWINGRHFAAAETTAIVDLYTELFPERRAHADLSRLTAAVELAKNRVSTLKEIDAFAFLFEMTFSVPELVLKTPEKAFIREFIVALEAAGSTDPVILRALAGELKDRAGLSTKDIYHLLRKCLTGLADGPDVYLIIGILGLDESLQRLKKIAGHG